MLPHIADMDYVVYIVMEGAGLNAANVLPAQNASMHVHEIRKRRGSSGLCQLF